MTRDDVVATVRGWAESRPPQVARSRSTLLTVAAIGQLFALLQLFGAWQTYRQPLVVLVFWVLLSAALPVLTLVAAREDGGAVTGRTVAPMIALLVVADVLVPAESTTDRIGAAGWNWSAVAIMLLALAVYRPVLEVMLCSLAHAAAVFGWAAISHPAVDLGTVILVAAGAIIPPLAAAQFVNFYVGILNEREEAGLRAAQIEAREAADAAVDQDDRRRLARIRAEVVPVLQHVASGASIPLDVEHAEAARRAAARLRSQLLEGRDVDWLFSATSGPDDDPAIEVRVVSDAGAREVLDDEIRSAIASLVSLLRRHRPWDRLAVTLTARQRTQLAVTVVATGDCAVRAARDPAVDTAVRRLGAHLSVVDERTVVIEGLVVVAYHQTS
jgi:hypothetical protein